MNLVLRAVHAVATLAVIAVPLLGWFTRDWSGATTLVVYWFETAAGCGFIALRILLHQRWSPRRGHFRYNPPSEARRGRRTGTFLSGFVVTSTVFCAAHALFLAVILVMLGRDPTKRFAQLDWPTVRFGCLCVLVILTLDLLVDLLTLRRWSFWAVEQMAQRGLSRVIVVHLTLIFGMAAVAFTGVSSSLFSVFVVLKSMAALSAALPQYEPERAPAWLSRFLNRVPNAHPGERFEDFWARDRDDERRRRAGNEEPYAGRGSG
jgi:cytochrome b561